MNIQQQHKAAVAMANTPMIRTMTDYQLVVQHRTAKEEKNDVMRLAIEIELERRGDLEYQAVKYFERFKPACSTEQLDRVAAKFDLYGSLAVWAGSEVVARCDWSI